ncbi:MAG: hypothetical protein ACTHMY_25105 [Solirubrobacteraceae bacterium]
MTSRWSGPPVRYTLSAADASGAAVALSGHELALCAGEKLLEVTGARQPSGTAAVQPGTTPS